MPLVAVLIWYIYILIKTLCIAKNHNIKKYIYKEINSVLKKKKPYEIEILNVYKKLGEMYLFLNIMN